MQKQWFINVRTITISVKMVFQLKIRTTVFGKTVWNQNCGFWEISQETIKEAMKSTIYTQYLQKTFVHGTLQLFLRQ